MPPTPAIIDRPQRWDASFDPDITEADIQRIMSVAPFTHMDPQKFPKRLTLVDIVQHDFKIRRFRAGEIIVREGDYGTSAFMILSGQVRVVLGPDLPRSMLGRRETKKKGLFRILAQVWNGNREPESFSRKELQQDSRTRISSRRGSARDARVFLQDVPRLLSHHKTAQLEVGEFFGEIAALSRMPRTATVFAEGPAELIEIRWQGLRDLLKYDDVLRRHIDQIYRERALKSHLQEIPFLSHLDDATLDKVMSQTRFATYGDYDWSGEYKRLAQSGNAGRPDQEPIVALEGDYPNGVVLVRAGFARLSQRYGHGHRTLNYFGAGQIYGFEEIAHNWRSPQQSVPLQYTLRVIGYTHLLIIPTSTMEEIVLPSLPRSEWPPLLPVKNPEEISMPVQPDVKDMGRKIGSDMLEFLTENRFFNGTATMVINLDRCTRCDDCVRACASGHDNNPRFLRHGPISGKVMVANACMHCADPVCMIGCPTGAIHREAIAGQVVINPATCIGCKACFQNCPYDAIRMVEIRDEQGAFLVDKEMKPIIKATKCDLCVEQWGGPACERACPHDALKRINLSDLDSFSRWLNR